MKKEKLNFNIDENFKSYFFKQFIFILINLFLFFLISYHYFPFIMSAFFMWLAIVVAILYLYFDIKFNSKIQRLEKRIDNLEYLSGRRK